MEIKKGDEKEVLTPEPTEEEKEDAEFERTLGDLESDKEPKQVPTQKPTRSELERATFTAKSTLKRIKELGGDPSALLADEKPATDDPSPVDTSNFVTKIDLARSEAQKLARTANELKVIMWYVENKGMSVSDAHFMANKGRIQKTLSEVTRTRDAVPSNGSGGAGQRQPENIEAPDLPQEDRRRLMASGMVYDEAKKAYVGKKVQHRYDEKSKTWITEKI